MECSLLHHGAAASSAAQAVTWIPSKSLATSKQEGGVKNDILVYASHAIINLVSPCTIVAANSGNQNDDNVDTVWKSHATLRTQIDEGNSALEITALCRANHKRTNQTLGTTSLVTGFSNGAISVWTRQSQSLTQDQQQQQQQASESESEKWQECVLLPTTTTSKNENEIDMPHRSITAVTALWLNETTLAVITGSSDGAAYYVYECISDVDTDGNKANVAYKMVHQQSLFHHTAVKSVMLQPYHYDQSLPSQDDTDTCRRTVILAFVGTAAPRHNRIHVHYGIDKELHYAGPLTGHLDWITCMDWWHGDGTDQSILATGSQDARIRLWRFTTTTTASFGTNPADDLQDPPLAQNTSDNETDDDDDNDMDQQAAEEEEEAGEARLEITLLDDETKNDNTKVTVIRVTLEALLLGHEEFVTHVSWHPWPQNTYQEKLLLISSSMDRSILLWTPSAEDGIWTPLTRGKFATACLFLYPTALLS